jgi:acyl-CoA synthetase (AMP-forming)/AMP-acid ligase II
MRTATCTLVDRRRELVLVNGFECLPARDRLAIESMDGIEEVAVVGIPTTLPARR